MHKTCSKQMKPELHLYLHYQWPRRSAPNQSVLLLPKKEKKDLLGRKATFYFILAGILIKRINSSKIKEDSQNVVVYGFVEVFFCGLFCGFFVVLFGFVS